MTRYLYNNLPHVVAGACIMFIGGLNLRTLYFAVIYVVTMSFIMRVK